MAIKRSQARKSPRALSGRPDRSGPLVLLDTNVVLDVLLARAPWVDDAVELLDAMARRQLRGCVAGHTLTTIYYLVERARDRRTAVTAVSDLLDLLEIVPLGGDDFRRALAMGLSDFEDAVQVAACLRSGAQFVVTRNPRDFRGAPVELRSPAEARALIPAAMRASEGGEDAN